MTLFRPFSTWIIRNKSKSIYLVFGLAFITLLVFTNNDRHTTRLRYTPKPLGSDVIQGSGGDNNANVIQAHVQADAPSSNNQSVAVPVRQLYDDKDYSQRQKEATMACKKRGGETAGSDDWLSEWPEVKREPKFRNDPMISTKTNLFYCPVGKVASSFFTRWVLAMNKPGPMTSPYDIAMKNAGRGRAESLVKSVPRTKRVEFLQHSTRVVFGRNPYSRIFSAYVDKLFSPNPFYWNLWGKKAVKLDDVHVKRCASDVTFAQFVNAVVKEIAKGDVHLIPVTVECNACQLPYTVVGRLESTVEDLDYASKLLNISSSFQHDPSYKSTAQKDAILDAVNSAFNWKHDMRACEVPLDEMGKRMWRKLQIRGVIDTAIDYPLKPGAIDRMSSKQFIEVCEKAIKESTNVVQLKKQRKEAMRLAYASVPGRLADEIKRVYDLDFAYFGYEKEAEFIRDMTVADLRTNSVIFQLDSPWSVL